MAQQPVRSDSRYKLPRRALLTSALETIANAIFITDHTGHIVWANHAFSELSGYAVSEVIGNTPSMLKSGMQSEAFYAQLWQTILSGKSWRGVVVERRKDGTPYTVDETITPLPNEHGVITHFISIQHDMTMRKQEDERDHYLAYHDVLTGLPNRALFLDILHQAMLHAEHTHHLVALMFMDLDKFKPVNDLFGHCTGDRLLQAVADRFSAAVRKSDTLARFGGDEFAILLPSLSDIEVAITLASKLISSITQPFMIEEHKIEIGLSIGIAIYPNDGEMQDELLAKADQAMYLAKNLGGSSYRFFRHAFS